MAAPTFPCRVLGLDPGSLRTGFGIVDCSTRGESHVASGCIRTRGADLAQRLLEIHEAVVRLIEEHCPHEVAIERVFMHRNPDSALKLGQARGAALSAAVTGKATQAVAATPGPTETTEADVKDAEKRQALWWYLLLTGLLLLAVETVVSNRLSQGERFL